ncbi:MAG: hypothetical protein ABWY00_01540 [Dongiaceae bacterium]
MGDQMSEVVPINDREQQSIGSLQAEIERMAELVFGVARETGWEAVTAALSLTAEGGAAAPDRVRDIANDVLARAEIMQTEIGRFMSVAVHTPLDDTKLIGRN